MAHFILFLFSVILLTFMYKMSNPKLILIFSLLYFTNSQTADAQETTPTSFTTTLLIANQYSDKVEIYDVHFDCNQTGCDPRPVQSSDMWWSTPVVEGLSEVKLVLYLGKYAILTTTENGAAVYEYPTGSVLFKKEIDESYYLNIHSAEVLPDGNVAVIGSIGLIVILYPEFNKTVQSLDTSTKATIPFGHGAAYHRGSDRFYVGGYLTVQTYQYSSTPDTRGKLTLLDSLSISDLYDEENKNENAYYEDGIHDIYPTNDDYKTMFLTTGEHVFTFNINNNVATKYPPLYTIPSKNSRANAVEVPNKGGVKCISKDARNDVVFVHAAPWFKELGDYNYYHAAPIVIWSMNKFSQNDGFCSQPDYDVTTRCKLDFSKLKQPMLLYKARVFALSRFSY